MVLITVIRTTAYFITVITAFVYPITLSRGIETLSIRTLELTICALNWQRFCSNRGKVSVSGKKHQI